MEKDCDPSKVVCSGDGLVFGNINHPIKARIDTTRAGPGSPFKLRVSPAGYVRVHGPGLEDNLIRQASGSFIVDAQEAGVGEVKVRVLGPKGKFRVETEKRGKQLVCRYNPKYPGMYTVEIYWSGDHVPGSPFQVYLCQTEEELKHHITVQALSKSDIADVAL